MRVQIPKYVPALQILHDATKTFIRWIASYPTNFVSNTFLQFWVLNHQNNNFRTDLKKSSVFHIARVFQKSFLGPLMPIWGVQGCFKGPHGEKWVGTNKNVFQALIFLKFIKLKFALKTWTILRKHATIHKILGF